MNVFIVKSLEAGYGMMPVLRKISASIDSGDFIGIIGPNGAGKSTLVKALAGLLPYEKGEIEFLGASLFDYSKPELARKMSVVPQFLENILPFLVKNFIATGRFPFKNFWERNTKEDMDIVNEALETTGTAHLGDRLLTTLSGGELQLVSIARALAQNKDILLLDEPISSLDLRHTVRIMDLLYALNKNGSTIITVLHDINTAADYCSKIIALKGGGIFFEDTPEKCLTGKTISSLFNKKCSVKKNPVTGRPYVYPHPEYL
ncbi:MAG: ABC transporter ATP-binding protein [Spirochaetes bacterium]|nr:ABC transporter ATP-binding protein [Spirochaetota bacterium]